MREVTLLLFIFCFFPSTVLAENAKNSAEGISIDFIQSSDGNNLFCSNDMAGEIRFDVYGEGGKMQTIVRIEGRYLTIETQTARYELPYYMNYEAPQNAYEERHKYYYHRTGLFICTACQDEQKKKADREYDQLLKILDAAHKQNYCQGWQGL